MQTINVGTNPNDGTGDSLRNAFIKVQNNFNELVAIDSTFSGDIQTINTIISDGSTLNHTHTISQIIGLQTALSGKVSTSTFNTQILDINSSIQAINSTLSDIIDILNTKIGDAPFSGITYGRRDGAWIQVSGGTGSTQSLAQTLVIGNETNGTNIKINNADAIELENGSLLKKGTYDFGDNGGISRICSVGYEDMWQAGFRHVFDNNGLIRNSTNCFNIVPDNTFDDTLRFKIGSRWTLDNGDTYECSDASTGAAVWSLVNNGTITGFVPYNGAIADVDLGSHSIIANNGFQTTWPYGLFQGGWGVLDEYKGLYFSNAGDGISVAPTTSTSITANLPSGIFMQSNTDVLDDPVNTKTSQLSIQGEVVQLAVSFDGSSNAVTINPTSTDSNKKVVSYEGFEGNYVQLNTANTETTAVAKLYWNDTDGTVNLGLKGGNVILQIGQEQVVRVVNKTATNITLQESAYQAVRITGAQGQRLKVDLALANNDLNSAETIGLVTETILNNQEGFVTTSGLVNKINTTGSLQGETWNDGDVVYLSASVAGRITNIKPSAPNHLVIIGYVVYSHSVNGKIFVKVDNGYKLDELHNVQVSGATNGQALVYNSVSNIWENSSNGIINLNSLTGSNQTFLTGTTGTNFNIVSSGTVHTFNLPTASAINRGALSSQDWTTFNNKQIDLQEFQTKQGFYFFEEFLGNPGSSAFGSYGIGTSTIGTGALCLPNTTYPNRTNQQGVIQLNTGTLFNGNSSIRIGDNNLGTHQLGNGVYTMQYFINVESLSTLTDRFYCMIGSATNSVFSNTNGIFFIYDEGVGTYGAASPNWKCITRNSLVTTSTITSVAVTASQWYVLKIIVNAGATSVAFYIDNVLVATHTTNIVTLITPRVIIQKNLGTTARNMYCDYITVKQIYTTPRTI